MRGEGPGTRNEKFYLSCHAPLRLALLCHIKHRFPKTPFASQSKYISSADKYQHIVLHPKRRDNVAHSKRILSRHLTACMTLSPRSHTVTNKKRKEFFLQFYASQRTVNIFDTHSTRRPLFSRRPVIQRQVN